MVCGSGEEGRLLGLVFRTSGELDEDFTLKGGRSTATDGNSLRDPGSN
jgi:hypothetical protein